MTTRKYSSRSQQTTLAAGITDTATSCTVVSGSALLGGATVPAGTTFTVVIDPDTALEEIVDVTVVSTNVLTITRGIENAGTGQAHSAGAAVRHMAIGRDFRETNLHIEATGGYNDGTGPHTLHGIASGEGVVVGTDKAQTLTLKTLTSPVITNPSISGAGVDASIVFEGATADAYETTLTVVDPTQDNTITLPNTTGTVVIANASQTLTNKTIDMTGVTLTGLSSAGMSVSSATPKNYVDSILGSATSASVSAASAAVSASSAAASATSAAASATASAASATTSASSASAASTSATNAAASATAAATSATAAATSATNSSTSAASSALSATQAATSETNAAASATTAANSVAAIAGYATTASNSASASASSAASAATSASSAATSASTMAASVTAAASSATAAATSATNAANSASAASTSETNAAASSSAASSSATSASSSATAANNSAIASASSASASASSAASAATSASSAASSQSSASTSATAAATSAASASTSATSAAASATAAAGYVVPSQTGNAGKYLKTDGTAVSWNTVEALPSLSTTITLQTGTAFSAVPTSVTLLAEFNMFNITQGGFYTAGDAAIFNAAFPVGSVIVATDSTKSGTFTVANVASITGGGVITVPITTSESSTIFFDSNTALVSVVSNAGKYLTNNGTTSSWGTVASILGSTAIAAGATVSNVNALTINGTTIPTSKTLVATDSYAYVVPSQTGNSGKYLTTDGTYSTWGDPVTKFAPLLEGVLTSATTSVTKDVPAGTYKVESAYPIKITVGSNSIITADSYSPKPFTVSSTETSVGLTNGGVGFGFISKSISGSISNLSPVKSIYATGKYLILNDSDYRTFLSTDGSTWTTGSIPEGKSWSGLAYGNGLFVAVANAPGDYYTSPDGVTWTTRSVPSGYRFATITYGNGKFVGLGGNVSTFAGATLVSTDGINWSVGSWIDPFYAGKSITYGGGKFVTVQGYSPAATSTDGVTWTRGSTTIEADYVTYGNGKYVAVGYDKAYVSTDGSTWTNSSLPNSNNRTDIAFGNGVFLVTSENLANVLSSTDGVTWSVNPIANTSFSSNSTICFGNGAFVASSKNASNDGTVFVDKANSTPFGIYSTPATTY